MDKRVEVILARATEAKTWELLQDPRKYTDETGAGSDLFRSLLILTALHTQGAPDNLSKGVISSVFGSGSGYGLSDNAVLMTLSALYSLGS